MAASYSPLEAKGLNITCTQILECRSQGKMQIYVLIVKFYEKTETLHSDSITLAPKASLRIFRGNKT